MRRASPGTCGGLSPPVHKRGRTPVRVCGAGGWRLEAPCEPGADPEFDEHCASPCSTAAPPNPSTCSVPLSWMYDPRRATSLGIEQRRVGPERRGGTVGGFRSRKHQANQARARPGFAAAVTAAPTSAPRRAASAVCSREPAPAGSRRVPSRPPVASGPRVARQPRRQVRAPASADRQPHGDGLAGRQRPVGGVLVPAHLPAGAPGCLRMKWVVLCEQVLDRIQDAFPRCIGRLRWQPVESCRVWTLAGTAVPEPASLWARARWLSLHVDRKIR